MAVFDFRNGGVDVVEPFLKLTGVSDLIWSKPGADCFALRFKVSVNAKRL